MTEYREHTVREIIDRISGINETIQEVGSTQPLVDKRTELQAELDRRSGFQEE